MKLLISPTSFELYGITTSNDGGWIHQRRDTDSSWSNIGILRVRTGYYYCDLAISSEGNNLYFGTVYGIYRLIIK